MSKSSKSRTSLMRLMVGSSGAAYAKIQYSSRRQMEKARSNYAEAPPLNTVHETRVHALDSRRPTTSPPGL